MLTKTRLKELFSYKDGELIRKVTTHYNAKKGDVVGCPHGNGYLDVRVDGKRYYLHRLIFLYHHGYFPEYLDHIDMDKSNNKIENLRACNKSQNSANTKAQKNNSLGIKNVIYDKHAKSYRVQLRHKKGAFRHRTKCLEFAEFLAEEARSYYHGEFANA
jgi:hypothetical protein